MSKPSSTIHKIHIMESKDIVKGKVVKHEEKIIDGSKGLTFKVFHQEGDKMDKAYGKSNADGTFDIVFVQNKEKKEHKNLSLADLKKHLKGNLKFVLDYLNNRPKAPDGSQSGGALLKCIHGGKCPYQQNNLMCPFMQEMNRLSRPKRRKSSGRKSSKRKSSNRKSSNRKSSNRKSSNRKSSNRKISRKGSKKKSHKSKKGSSKRRRSRRKSKK